MVSMHKKCCYGSLAWEVFASIIDYSVFVFYIINLEGPVDAERGQNCRAFFFQ